MMTTCNLEPLPTEKRGTKNKVVQILYRQKYIFPRKNVLPVWVKALRLPKAFKKRFWLLVLFFLSTRFIFYSAKSVSEMKFKTNLCEDCQNLVFHFAVKWFSLNVYACEEGEMRDFGNKASQNEHVKTGCKLRRM